MPWLKLVHGDCQSRVHNMVQASCAWSMCWLSDTRPGEGSSCIRRCLNQTHEGSVVRGMLTTAAASRTAPQKRSPLSSMRFARSHGHQTHRGVAGDGQHDNVEALEIIGSFTSCLLPGRGLYEIMLSSALNVRECLLQMHRNMAGAAQNDASKGLDMIRVNHILPAWAWPAD